MVTRKNWFNFSMLLLTIFMTPVVFAEGGEICAPFKNASIDQSLISRMLNAAEDGYLYQIKTNTSQMGFCVDSPIGLVTGNFKNFNGGMALEGVKSQAMVKIDVASLETDGVLIDSLLKSDKFFDVENYPDLIFVSSGFEWLSDSEAVIKGELSMHGVTKKVAFYVDITEVEGELGDSNTIFVKATTTVQRSEFGMYTLSPMVSDKVNLCMSIEAERFVSL